MSKSNAKAAANKAAPAPLSLAPQTPAAVVMPKAVTPEAVAGSVSILVAKKFTLNLAGELSTFPPGLHRVTAEVAEHPYTVLHLGDASDLPAGDNDAELIAAYDQIDALKAELATALEAAAKAASDLEQMAVEFENAKALAVADALKAVGK